MNPKKRRGLAEAWSVAALLISWVLTLSRLTIRIEGQRGPATLSFCRLVDEGLMHEPEPPEVPDNLCVKAEHIALLASSDERLMPNQRLKAQRLPSTLVVWNREHIVLYGGLRL